MGNAISRLFVIFWDAFTESWFRWMDRRSSKHAFQRSQASRDLWTTVLDERRYWTETNSPWRIGLSNPPIAANSGKIYKINIKKTDLHNVYYLTWRGLRSPLKLRSKFSTTTALINWKWYEPVKCCLRWLCLLFHNSVRMPLGDWVRSGCGTTVCS